MMTLSNFQGRRFQNFLSVLLLSGALLFSATLASPPRAAGNVDCALWFAICIPPIFANWCPECFIACWNEYLFCLSYFPQ
jgi:hypothetical protein